jgi:hypothetical protein
MSVADELGRPSMSKTVHFVYPRDAARHASPFCIGNEVGDRLARDYPVRFYDWRDRTTIRPSPGDVLVGHPHRRAGTVFTASLRDPNFSRRILMQPYAPDMRQNSYTNQSIDACDLFLAITGNYWFERIGASAFARWQPKMRHMDLAVNRTHFPLLKTRFNPPGQRRFVYIGNTAHLKNTGYLSRLRAMCRGADITWIGRGKRRIAGVPAIGFIDFSQPQAHELIRQFDFMITVGALDPNPTTILESMAWGLIPVCTPQSGYDHAPGIVNLPLDDVAGAQSVFDQLQRIDDQELLQLQAQGQAALARHYHWDRFYAAVRDAIESRESPPLRPATLAERLRFRFYDLIV